MGEILGINFEAIKFVLDIYQIRDSDERLEIFEKINAIDSVRIRQKSEQISSRMREDQIKAAQRKQMR